MNADPGSSLRIQLVAPVKSERGASAVEYGLLVALIAIVIIVAVTPAGHQPVGRLQQDRQQHPVGIDRGTRLNGPLGGSPTRRDAGFGTVHPIQSGAAAMRP